MSERPLHEYSMRVLDRPAPGVSVTRSPDGIVYLQSTHAYQPGRASLIEYLEHAVSIRPDVTFIAQRGGDGEWQRLTYAKAWRDSAAIATWLIRKGLGPQSAPLMILSGNSLAHALLMLGALRAGVAVVPVSPTYSVTQDFGRLVYALDLIQPALVFAQDAVRYADALSHAAASGRIVITEASFPELLRDIDEEAITKRRAAITHATAAKILLTSGSTGRPKGVINTHGNLVAGMQMVRMVTEPFSMDRVYTILCWLPWHHTFGGNSQFNSVLAMAGTLYIDDGRPLPGCFAPTIANLREISPTGFVSVPAAFGMLADALEGDTNLRAAFFKNLRWLNYGGALLPQVLWDRMQRLAVHELGELVPFGTGWGMTETTATGVAVYWNTRRTGLVGLPQPGAILKLVPSADRLELRIKGPHVLPAYLRDEALNQSAFDEEGFFRTGDATRWVDADKPIEGLEFAGRMAEDFKLESGTWVQGSIMRRDLVAALQPYVLDAVICAPHRPWLGAMLWLTVAYSDAVRDVIAKKLVAFNAERKGSANVIARAMILAEPPSAALGEITDKRSINQRFVLENRAADVARLYDDAPSASIIVATSPAMPEQQP